MPACPQRRPNPSPRNSRGFGAEICCAFSVVDIIPRLPPPPPSPAHLTPAFLSAAPSPPSFFAAFGSKHAASSKSSFPSSSSEPLKRCAPAVLADDDDDAPLVACCLPPSDPQCSDDDLSPQSATKRHCSSSELAAKFNRYTAGSSPVVPQAPAPRLSASNRTVGGGSGYGTAKFEAANSERYQWLENVRDAQGRRPGEPGALA
jgi:hypothetical protein